MRPGKRYAAFLVCVLPAFLHLSSARAVIDYGTVEATSVVRYTSVAENVTSSWVPELRKRDCTSTGHTAEDGAEIYTCDHEYPTMDEVRQKAIRPGGLDGKTVSFYAFLVPNHPGSVTLIKQFCACHADILTKPCIAIDTAVDSRYVFAEKEALNRANKNGFVMLNAASQAYAEAASGDVYFFTQGPPAQPYDGVDESFRRDITWFGWEFPALQRNMNVNRIYRVDPRVGYDNSRMIYWDRARDGINTDEPRGVDYSVTGPPPRNL